MAQPAPHPDQAAEDLLRDIVITADRLHWSEVAHFTEAVRRTCLAIVADVPARKAAERAAKARR